MKIWFALLSAFTLSASGLANEIKMRGAAWDNVSHALNLTPFYFEIKSSTPARTVTLILDVYQDGKLVKTYRSAGLSREKAQPIDLKSALFFNPKEDSPEYAVTWTLDAQNGSGITRFAVPKSVVDFSKGVGSGAVTSSIATSTRSLISIINCMNNGRFSMGDSLEATLADNKGATIIGVFLERD